MSSQQNEDKTVVTVNEKSGASSQEEVPTAAKPAGAKQPRKERYFDPTGTVDIPIGQSGIAANTINCSTIFPTNI